MAISYRFETELVQLVWIRIVVPMSETISSGGLSSHGVY